MAPSEHPDQEWVIPIEAIRQSRACTRQFACLTGDKPHCAISACLDGTVHFLACEGGDCVFKVPAGERSACTCPVRKELFNRYGV
jgi:hypothetical protein